MVNCCMHKPIPQYFAHPPFGARLSLFISEDLFKQKLEYIHYNPVKAGLCESPEEYHFSSAKFYEDGTDLLGMLKHYSGN